MQTSAKFSINFQNQYQQLIDEGKLDEICNILVSFKNRGYPSQDLVEIYLKSSKQGKLDEAKIGYMRWSSMAGKPHWEDEYISLAHLLVQNGYHVNSKIDEHCAIVSVSITKDDILCSSIESIFGRNTHKLASFDKVSSECAPIRSTQAYIQTSVFDVNYQKVCKFFIEHQQYSNVCKLLSALKNAEYLQDSLYIALTSSRVGNSINNPSDLIKRYVSSIELKAEYDFLINFLNQNDFDVETIIEDGGSSITVTLKKDHIICATLKTESGNPIL